MRRFRREEGNGSREVEGEEQAVDAQARVNPGGEILLQNMHPQVEEDAPQAVADEQSENVPEAAVHPEGMIGGQHPINPVEAGNFPIHPNEEGGGGEAGNRMERTPNEPSPKQKKICIMVMFVIIFYLIIGTIYFNAYKFQTQNETIPLTDIDVNVTTPMTTTIFTITT